MSPLLHLIFTFFIISMAYGQIPMCALKDGKNQPISSQVQYNDNDIPLRAVKTQQWAKFPIWFLPMNRFGSGFFHPILVRADYQVSEVIYQ
ncbi:hypothetical protein TrispH2_002777 [Trichoplax sp. H2]|nr:hypothetical protein TrispH2_002777 [Trichoplax sp. H2]|eukprot:RDD45620.1 hypothetical protein TrispH2_002777 [Trichoplax sp. H2]